MSIEHLLERIATALEAIAISASALLEAAAAKKPTAVQPARAHPIDDSLSSTPPAKQPTLEELRAALQAYAKEVDATAPGTGMVKARELLGKHGNGANRLAVAKDVPGGEQGVIELKYYQAVIDAAKPLH
jgi:hypothetical protein